MRHAAIIGTLVLATALAPAAHAGWPGKYIKIHGTTDNLTWHGAKDRAVELSSKDGRGIKVVTISPEGQDGLHKGDLITAVDGYVVAHVVDLVTFANAHMKDPAKLSVSRDDHTMDVVLAAGELGALVHPQP
jgi:S1-C subfamily serine protease